LKDYQSPTEERRSEQLVRGRQFSLLIKRMKAEQEKEKKQQNRRSSALASALRNRVLNKL
jgi:hypothetical protein